MEKLGHLQRGDPFGPGRSVCGKRTETVVQRGDVFGRASGFPPGSNASRADEERSFARPSSIHLCPPPSAYPI